MSVRIAVSWEHCFPLRLNATSAKYFFRVSRLTELSFQFRGFSGSPDSLALPILTTPKFLVGRNYAHTILSLIMLVSYPLLPFSSMLVFILFEGRSLCFASPNDSDTLISQSSSQRHCQVQTLREAHSPAFDSSLLHFGLQ